MADDRLAWKFRRAARQRMVAVDLLLAHALYFDAVYLAGYVVECGLKALLLNRTPEKDRHELVKSAFRGRRGHEFTELTRLLRLQHCPLPIEIATRLTVVRQWSTALRYEPGSVPKADADAFVKSARAILEWTERSA